VSKKFNGGILLTNPKTRKK